MVSQDPFENDTISDYPAQNALSIGGCIQASLDYWLLIEGAVDQGFVIDRNCQDPILTVNLKNPDGWSW